MGLIWNNEYVLEKNKEPHKTGYSSTEATEMADNCFQVWHRSVNEFVLFCGQLTVSFLPFISHSTLFPASHTQTHTFWFSSLRLCFLVIWPPYSPAPWLFSTPSFTFFLLSLFSSCLLSKFHILQRSRLFTSLLYSLFPLFVLLAC